VRFIPAYYVAFAQAAAKDAAQKRESVWQRMLSFFDIESFN
jgi:hypothetical protein